MCFLRREVRKNRGKIEFLRLFLRIRRRNNDSNRTLIIGNKEKKEKKESMIEVGKIHRDEVQVNKQRPNVLLDFSFEEEEDPVELEKQESENIEEKFEPKVQKASLMNVNKLTILDWSEGSEQEQEKSAKILEAADPKQQNLIVTEQQDLTKTVNKQNFAKEQRLSKIINSQTTTDFLFEQLPPKTTVNCIIRRDKQNNQGLTQYNIYFEQNLKHILTIKKEGVWKHCIYLRFCKGSTFTYSKIATIESNFLGNRYTLLRNDSTASQITVKYETKIFGYGGPRKMHIYLPKEILNFEYLDEIYQNQNMDKFIEKCVSKSANWNQKIKSFTLNFRGKAQQSSIKNFVITDQKQKNENYFIIFGKAGPDIFNLDIQSPFSLIQAITVAVSSFQRKLTCD